MQTLYDAAYIHVQCDASSPVKNTNLFTVEQHKSCLPGLVPKWPWEAASFIQDLDDGSAPETFLRIHSYYSDLFRLR